MKNVILFSTVLLVLSSCFKKEIVEDHKRSTVDSAAVIADSAAMVVDSAVIVPVGNSDVLLDSVNAPATMTYTEASRLNSSTGWKQFLIDNPNYKDKKEIEENIIRAEVREISSDSNTGQMPEAEKLGSRNSSTSTIEVENDTSCDLTLLYSGTDAKKIVISPNSKKKVSLRSGNYSVAANACGYNYAGSENLSGDYSVVYYISSVRY